jgi:hypothetical protein
MWRRLYRWRFVVILLGAAVAVAGALVSLSATPPADDAAAGVLTAFENQISHGNFLMLIGMNVVLLGAIYILIINVLAKNSDGKNPKTKI